MRSLAILVIFPLTLSTGVAETFSAPPPSTYKTVTVADIESCKTLCEADKPRCRGTIAAQPDITIPTIQCHLNDGLRAGSPFEITPPPDLDLSAALADLNRYRRKFGLSPLSLSDKLNEASKIHSDDMATHDITAHKGTDGSSHSDRVQRQGYYFTTAAENVASGQKSWEDVFAAWKKSPGHNENLLRDDVTEFGIALSYNPKSSAINYWAMIVAAPWEDYVPPIQD